MPADWSREEALLKDCAQGAYMTLPDRLITAFYFYIFYPLVFGAAVGMVGWTIAEVLL